MGSRLGFILLSAGCAIGIGNVWSVHGYAAVAGNYLLMMFYATVAGWMLRYFVSTAAGRFNGIGIIPNF